jgi:SAM-dependent methyltransferase
MSREAIWARQTSLKPIHPHQSDEEFWGSGKDYYEEYLKEHIKPTDCVLDFGCGVGRISKHVPCRQLYLYDINPEYLFKAALHTGGVYLPSILDPTEAPFIDVVFAISVFIHMDWKTAEATFKKLAAISNSMLLQLPTYEHPSPGKDWIDVTTYSKNQILGWCKDVNFRADVIPVNPGSFTFKNIGPCHNRPIHFVRNVEK